MLDTLQALPLCKKSLVGNVGHFAGATTLVEFVEAAGLAEALQGEGPFSVAAPSNDAFAKVGLHWPNKEDDDDCLQLPAELVDTLKADTELLKKVGERRGEQGEHVCTAGPAVPRGAGHDCHEQRHDERYDRGNHGWHPAQDQHLPQV